MNFNNFTTNRKEAVQQAVNLVQSRGTASYRAGSICFGRGAEGWRKNVTNLHFPETWHLTVSR